MNTRQLVLVGSWSLTLGLLAWAAAPESSPPAAAWTITTFPTNLGPGGESVRVAAPEGGYAQPGLRAGDRPYGPRGGSGDEGGAGGERPLEGAGGPR